MVEVICANDPYWDAILRYARDVDITCLQCGCKYRAIDNLGSWHCQVTREDRNTGKIITFDCDHNYIFDLKGQEHKKAGKPKTLHPSDMVVPEYVLHYFRHMVPDAVLRPQLQQSTGETSNGELGTFVRVVVRRYNYIQKLQKIRRKDM